MNNNTTILRSLIVGAIIGLVGVFLVAITGCAHVTAVAKSCEPTVAQVVAVGADFATDGYEVAIAKLIATEGFCLVSAAVDQFISTASDVKASGIDIAISLQHAQAWRAAHPGPP
jgi:hypothetical protein